MSNKDKISELRDKLYTKKKELQAEEATQVHEQQVKEFEQTLDFTVHDVYQDTTKKGRHFIMVEIKYNAKTGEAKVVESRPFIDKVAGIVMVADKDNRKYLFNKSVKGDK